MNQLPRPEASSANSWRFPTPDVRELANGLTVWRFNLPGQHVVTAQLVLDVPLTLEVPEVEGIATIALRTSDEGTVQHPGEQLVDALESAGAAFDGGASASATLCSIDVPNTRLATALPLLAEIVQSPQYDPADVERHVALRLAELEQTMVSAPSLAALAVRRVVFDDSSREARPQGGLPGTVAAITPELVRAFHDRHWRPDGATLILAGDLDDSVDVLVDQAFGGWGSVSGTALHVIPTPRGAQTVLDGKRVVHLVDLPGAVQTEIRVSGIGVDRTSLDFAPLQVAANAMGGSFGSRLNTVLREEKGYTYGVHFSVAPARLSGSWAVSASVRTEVTVDALAETLRIMALDEDFTADEVSDAINQQLGIAPLRYDTAGAIANQAATLAASGWEADFVNLHFTRVGQVTPGSASVAYRKIVRPDNSHVVLVGDAEQLRPALESAGYAVQPVELLQGGLGG
ncbi:pitrilysin family protein [Luteococcus sp. H138]|uniref:M16 family metallopeptidase n=1 Tax=unclassified Luteococcus TaxID=2639923 RepID=UPI00313B6281